MTGEAKLPEPDLKAEVKEALLRDVLSHGISISMLKNDGTVERIDPAEFKPVEKGE